MQSARLKESTAANYRMKAEKHIIPAFGTVQCCLLKAKESIDMTKGSFQQKSAFYVTSFL